MKLWNLIKVIHHIVPLLENRDSIGIPKVTHGFRQISIFLKLLAVIHDPRHHWILCEILVASPRNFVKLHQILEICNLVVVPFGQGFGLLHDAPRV